MEKKIRLLIVEDSPVWQDFLLFMLSESSDIVVVGVANDGEEAIKLAQAKKPDVISMDIEMPVMNGIDATREIMSTNPIPIVIISSSYHVDDVEKSFDAIDAGALAILAKPVSINHPDYQTEKKHYINTVRAMSEVKLVTRSRKFSKKSNALPDQNYASNNGLNATDRDYKIVAIGVSTGGPQVLQQMLELLPADFSIPIVVVQHIPSGFLEGMVSWLSQFTKLKICIAKNGEKLAGNRIYFCPAEYHIVVNSNMHVELIEDIPNYKIRPSVSSLFASVAKNLRQQAIGILLTGMGKDGANELLKMKEAGAVTIIQDEASAVVFGMPGEALKINACNYVLPPKEIVKKLEYLNKTSVKTLNPS